MAEIPIPDEEVQPYPFDSGFLAYSSDPATSDFMQRLKVELTDAGAKDVVSWQDLNTPGLLWPPIEESIRAAELVLAETTGANLNVLFELGFAIGLGKHTFELRRANAQGYFVSALDLVRFIAYERRQDVIDRLKEIRPTDAVLADQLGIRTIQPTQGGLYFLPGFRAGDVNDTLWARCASSPFNGRTVDVTDSSYRSLGAQAAAIAASELVVAILVGVRSKEFETSNAQMMLFAGLAAALGKELLVLSQQPGQAVLDLGDKLVKFETETEADRLLTNWLAKATQRRIQQPTVARAVVLPPTSPLAGLFLGSLDARADFKLSDYFVETPEFHQAESGSRHLFVGNKGSGKTALYEELRSRLQRRNRVVVTIAPAEFEFPRLASIFDELRDAHWEFVYGSFWRFILITETMHVIRNRFYDMLLRRKGEQWADDLARWCDLNGDLLDRDFVSRVSAVLEGIATIEGNDELRRQLIDDLLQSARMYEIQRSLKEFSRRIPISLIVDDLDRNWSADSESAQRLIVALLNSVEHLQRGLGDQFTPALFMRRDVYLWLISHDPESLKRDAATLRWDRESLEILVAQRIISKLGLTETDPVRAWLAIFPDYVGAEPVSAYVVSRTLERPRDVVQFCQRSVENAQRAGRVKISAEDIESAWEPSGEMILAQIETEYQHRYPGLGEIALAYFEQSPSRSWKDLAQEIAGRASGSRLPSEWLGRVADNPRLGLEALYSTGIVGIESSGGSVWYESGRPMADLDAVLPDDFHVVLRLAFRRYLRCWGA